MAILEEEVLVGLASPNIKHFENKGYNIPRVKSSDGKLRVPIGTEILVKVDDLPEGSSVLLTKICDKPNCGKHVPNQEYGQILKYRKRGDGNDCCWECAKEKRWVSRKNNMPYEKSLECYALQNNMEYLLEEFSDNNRIPLIKLSFGTTTEALWECKVCKSEYPMKVCDRTNGTNCPYCAGHRVNYTNCIWTTHPQIAKLLKNPERGYKLTAGSNETEIFICKDCGFNQYKVINNITTRGSLHCSRCGDNLSYPEKFTLKLLDQIRVPYQTQKVFSWSNNKRYDFYIPSSTIIETHGIQHYTYSGFGQTVEEIQQNDEYKMKLALLNDIENYIVLDCRVSNMEFIKNSILNSKLGEIYNLENINWLKCHEFACNSNLMKEVCSMWVNIGNVTKIADIMKLDRTTILTYLKKGVELGWCNYDPKLVMKETRVNNSEYLRQKQSIKIIQLTVTGGYIKDWESATEAMDKLGIHKSNITAVCRGKRGFKTAGGFRWMYKEDYERNKNNLNLGISKTAPRNVVKLDKNNNFLEEYESITVASKCTGVNLGNIGNVCSRGEGKTAGGFKWMYKTDYDKLTKTQEII